MLEANLQLELVRNFMVPRCASTLVGYGAMVADLQPFVLTGTLIRGSRAEHLKSNLYEKDSLEWMLKGLPGEDFGDDSLKRDFHNA